MVGSWNDRLYILNNFENKSDEGPIKNSLKNDCKIKWLTSHGYSVASISYRLSQIAKFPAQIHDCKGAIRWLKSQGNKFGYDSSKIVAAGASAGGYLATLLGTSHGVKQLEGEVGGNLEMQSSLSGIINFYGPTDSILRSNTQPHRANRRQVNDESGCLLYS